MNLLLIARKIWRYKLVTLPVIGLVVAGAYYVLAVKDPVYEATSTYILVNPPPPPTEDEVAQDPKLGIGSDNPYTRYSDQSVVVQVLTSRLSSDVARRELEQRGADPDYEVAPSSEFGFTAPLVQITGTGPTPAAAVRTARLIGRAVTRELAGMQQARGVAEKYRIDAQQVVVPRDAKLKASGQLRSLVAVFALGLVLMFIVVSVADALSTLRAERLGGGGRSRLGPEDGLGLVRGERTPDLAGGDLDNWSGLDSVSSADEGIVDLFPGATFEGAASRKNGRAKGRRIRQERTPRP
jgi:capsular polysaccharide biosynthesis protein